MTNAGGAGWKKAALVIGTLVLVAAVGIGAFLLGRSKSMSSGPAGTTTTSTSLTQASKPAAGSATSSPSPSVPSSPIPFTSTDGLVRALACEAHGNQFQNVAIATGYFFFDTGPASGYLGTTLDLRVYDATGSEISTGPDGSMTNTNTIHEGQTNYQAETNVMAGFTPASCTITVDAG